MTSARIDELLGILQQFFNPREEGWLWLAFYADDAPGGVLNQMEGQYEEPVATAESLAYLINEIAPDRASIALCRWDGRPTEDDRELWRRLDRLVSADRLLDMIVFNAGMCWSMRSDDVTSPRPSKVLRPRST